MGEERKRNSNKSAGEIKNKPPRRAKIGHWQLALTQVRYIRYGKQINTMETTIHSLNNNLFAKQ